MSLDISIIIDGADTTVSLRKIKKKELKPLAQNLAAKLDELILIASSRDFAKKLPAFFSENIDFICSELVLPFTSLSDALLDETDVSDIVYILGQLLSYNGIDFDKLLNFFRGSPAAVKSPVRAETFSGISVPSVS